MMPATQPPDWPVRGMPGGYHDVWDDPDPATMARDQAARIAREVDPIAEAWRAERAHRAARGEVRPAPSPAEDAPASAGG
jgi:hypothetical protein